MSYQVLFERPLLGKAEAYLERIRQCEVEPGARLAKRLAASTGPLGATGIPTSESSASTYPASWAATSSSSHSTSGVANYHFMRNVKGVLEVNAELLAQEWSSGAFATGHLPNEHYALCGIDAAF